MKIEYFKFYHRYDEYIRALSDSEVGRLVKSLLKYSMTGETSLLNGRERILYDIVIDDIYRTKKEQEEKSSRLSQNASKRWNEKKSSMQLHDFASYNKDTSPIQRDNYIPLKDEVAEYCKINGIKGIDPERFCNYYSARGWKTKDGCDIYDWTALVRIWSKNEFSDKNTREKSFDEDEFYALASKKSFTEEKQP